MLFDTQRFVATIIFRQPRPPRLWWSTDYRQVTIETHLVVIDKVRSGIQDMLKDAWGLLDKLTGGKRFATKLPANFKDDLINETRNYSFLDHGPFTDEPNALMTYLIDQSSCNFATIDASDRLSFNMPAVCDWLATSAKLNKILAVLSFIIPTISTRISQFVANKIRNLDRPRNLHMLLNEMFYFVRYHKMTNLTGIDVCIPVFFPPALVEIMLEYICGGVRDVEEAFGGIAYGRDAKNAYHSYVHITVSFVILNLTDRMP
jgi:hypothetical protein